MSQIIAGLIVLSFAAGTSQTSSRNSSFVASSQCCSRSILRSQRSFRFKSQLKFYRVDELGMVGLVYHHCVLLILGKISVGDESRVVT